VVYETVTCNFHSWTRVDSQSLDWTPVDSKGGAAILKVRGTKHVPLHPAVAPPMVDSESLEIAACVTGLQM